MLNSIAVQIVLMWIQTGPRWLGRRQGVEQGPMMVLQLSIQHANGVYGKTNLPHLLKTGVRPVTGRIVLQMRGIDSDKALQMGVVAHLVKIMIEMGGPREGTNHLGIETKIGVGLMTITNLDGLGHAQGHQVDIGEDDLDHEASSDLINEDDEIDAYIMFGRIFVFL